MEERQQWKKILTNVPVVGMEQQAVAELSSKPDGMLELHARLRGVGGAAL
jgi:hypothetical protein